MSGSKVFFVSDVHLGHAKVLEFDNRPWNTLEEMNKGLIERWNQKVGKNDHVYILGDLCWLSGAKAVQLVEQLNGTLHLIRGNHDRMRHKGYSELFASIKDYDVIKVRLENSEKVQVVLCHYPILLYNGHHRGAIHLYGHVHATSEEKDVQDMRALLINRGETCIMYNVWCGYYDWAPATLDEIISKWTFDNV
jgi:calcineurin-like phosphoesterase family protein